MRFILILLFLASCIYASAQQPAKKGLNVNNKGMDAKNSKGGGLEVHKKQVAVKGNSGKGVEANKKGLDVKGSKGGMTIQKKKLEIKGKNTNIHFGK